MLNTSFVSLSLMLAVPALAVGQEKKEAASKNGAINVFPNCAEVPNNLVLNCGFETMTFENWTLSGDTSLMMVTTDAHHSGNWGAKIGPVNFPGFLSQTLSTVPGQLYDLTFWLHNTGQPNQFLLYWDGTLISTTVNFPDTPNRAELNFDQPLFTRLPPPIGSNTVLTFGFMNRPSFFFLDDIVVISSASGSPAN